MNEIDELRKKIQNHEERLSKIEAFTEKKSLDSVDSNIDKQLPPEKLRLIVNSLQNLKVKELVILSLKFYGNLTRLQQIQVLKRWGKKEASSLEGGNYKRDIINTGLVHELKKIGKETIYALTEKGKIEVDKIMKELQDKQREE